MIGTVAASMWRTIAADIDGVPQPDQVGQRREQREAKFAYRAEAEQWLAEQQAEGFDGKIGAAAWSYYGPTDAPSNSWWVTVERIIP